MNEIEKLYENAGIKKEKIFWCGEYDCFPKEHPQGYQINRFKNCGLCSYTEYKYVYPTFTAEKQLNLIILLANREIRISPTYISSGYYLNDLNKIKSSRNISTFEDSLAQHINAIWQDLTEEEKQQIKEVFE